MEVAGASEITFSIKLKEYEELMLYLDEFGEYFKIFSEAQQKE
jgi:hypothetical protein